MKKPVNRLTVTYLVDNCGVPAGTVKSVKADIANELAERKIVSLGEKSKDEAPKKTKDQPAGNAKTQATKKGK